MSRNLATITIAAIDLATVPHFTARKSRITDPHILGRIDLRAYYSVRGYRREDVQSARKPRDGKHDPALHGRITAPTSGSVYVIDEQTGKPIERGAAGEWLAWWNDRASTIATPAIPSKDRKQPAHGWTLHTIDLAPVLTQPAPLDVDSDAPGEVPLSEIPPARPRDIKRGADGIGWIIDHPAHAGANRIVYSSRDKARAALSA